MRRGVLGAALFFSGIALLSSQSTQPGALGYSIVTPHPINPAESTTNPSAQATQSQNPYLGSVPTGQATSETLRLSLREIVERGLRYNLGLVESNQSGAEARAARLRALAALLPQISGQGRQVYADLSLKEIGLKLPSIPGFPGLPATTGGFAYQDVRLSLTQSLYNSSLRNQYQAQKSAEASSRLSIEDAKDVVVFAVGTAYWQAVASAARVETAKAQLASAQELDRQTANQVQSEVSPEIDSLRAQVQRQSAEQRLTNAVNQWEKDKLTLARITGLPMEQKFSLTETGDYRSLAGITLASATEEAFHSRADLASAEAGVQAAEFTLRAQRAQRLPVLSLSADYGGAGLNVGSFNQVYTVAGSVSVPFYTGGRIRADIQQAQADLERRQAQYADLKGRVTYDVRAAWLDLQASDSSVRVAQRNQALAARALTEAQDRYTNGVTNYLEVVQAQETTVAANENYIQSLYSFNVSKLALARAMGAAEKRWGEFWEVK
jgi:outer membrane protein TolC